MAFEKKDFTETERERKKVIEILDKLREWKPNTVQEILDAYNRDEATLMRQTGEWVRVNKFINEEILHQNENKIGDIYVRTTEIERAFNTIINIVEDFLKVTRDYRSVINYLNSTDTELITRQINEIQDLEFKKNEERIQKLKIKEKELKQIKPAPLVSWNEIKFRMENAIITAIEIKNSSIKNSISRVIISYTANHPKFKKEIERMKNYFFSIEHDEDIIKFLELRINRKIVRWSGGQQSKTEDSNNGK